LATKKIAKKNAVLRTIYGMIKIKLKEAKKSSSKIWKMVPIGKAATPSAKTGRLSQKEQYAVVHIPSGMKIPTDYYRSTKNDVKALIQFLDSQSWPDITSSTPSMETIESIHDVIIDSKFSRPSMKYTKVTLNEGLQGLMLPDILNTKVMEYAFSGKTQETFGRFVRDWILNWSGDATMAVTQMITMNLDATRRLMKPAFFHLYEKNGGNKQDLLARDGYYAFTSKTWQERLRAINLTGMMDKKLAEWRRDLVRSLGPGQGNDVDAEILDKALDDFIEMKKFLQDQGSRFYRIKHQGPQASIDSKGSNYSHMWSQHRRVLKSIRKYLVKRGMPSINSWIQNQYDTALLYMFNAMNRSRNVVKLRKYLNENEKNWVDIDKLLKDPGDTYNSETGEGVYKDSMDAIADFVEKAKYRHAYDTMCSDLGSGELAPKGKPCVIKKYDDGFFWFSRGSRSCEIFGEEGRNCGGGKFTLIDLQKTIKRGENTRRSWRIGLDYDVNGGVLHQILGVANSFPMERHWSYIKDFIDTYNVQSIDSEVFQYLTDNDKVSEEEVMKFIMAVGNEAIKSKWIDDEEENQKKRDAMVDDIAARALEESQNRWKRNLNYQPPKKIDAKKAHAAQSWYKNKRNKIK